MGTHGLMTTHRRQSLLGEEDLGQGRHQVDVMMVGIDIRHQTFSNDIQQ